MRKLIALSLPLFLLTGCAPADWKAINQTISDTAESLNQTLGGTKSTATGGMPFLSAPKPVVTEAMTKNFTIPVDVDTAAARLKRYYKFISTQELDAMRKTYNGAWTASAIDSAHPVWEAMPGSYYKMGIDWNDEQDHDHLDIEVEKNGAGSTLYITYRSPSAKRLAGGGVENLMNNIRAVAVGEKR